MACFPWRWTALCLLLLLAACQAWAPPPIAPLPGGPPASETPAQRPAQPTTPAPSLSSPLPSPSAAASLPLPTPASLTVALAREPLTLDPGDLVDPVGALVLRQVFDTLVQFKAGSAEIEPGLATAWQANADATEWTFTLRPGVRFHDGVALTADAVKVNFERWLDPAFRAGNRAEGKLFSVWSDIFGGYRGAGSLVTAVDVVDGQTVRVRTSQPAAYLPALLALPYFGLSSPQAVEQAGARYGSPDGGAVGTGPFTLDTWSGGVVRLKRWDGYWGGAARAESVRFVAAAEPEARLALLADGHADIVPDLPPDRRAALAQPDLVTLTRPSLAIVYLSLNQRYRPLDDARVRQAIALALDPAALTASAFGGAATPADQFVPPGLWGRLPASSPLPSPNGTLAPGGSAGGGAGGAGPSPANPDRAKALLAEAGFSTGLSEVAGPDGIARPLELVYAQPPRGLSLAPLAQDVARQLGAAGVRVTLRQDEWASFLAERKQGRFALYLLVYPVPSSRAEGVGDPHFLLNGLFGPLTVSETAYPNTAVPVRLREAEAIADPARRVNIYREVAQAVQGDLPRVPLAYPVGLAGARRGVQGYVPSPLGSESLAGTSRE